MKYCDLKTLFAMGGDPIQSWVDYKYFVLIGLWGFDEFIGKSGVVGAGGG